MYKEFNSISIRNLGFWLRQIAWLHGGRLFWCVFYGCIPITIALLTMTIWYIKVNCFASQWHHNERDGVSNYQPYACLLNRLFNAQIEETSKLRVTGLCEGNSPVTAEFPAHTASNAENVSIWWRHHVVRGRTEIGQSRVADCSGWQRMFNTNHSSHQGIG